MNPLDLTRVINVKNQTLLWSKNWIPKMQSLIIFLQLHSIRNIVMLPFSLQYISVYDIMSEFMY